MSSCASAAAAKKPLPVPDEEEEGELELPPLDGALDERDEPLDAGSLADDLADEKSGADDAAPADFDTGWTLEDLDAASDADADPAHPALDVGALDDDIDVPEPAEPGADDSGPTADAPEEASPFDAAFESDAGSGTGEDPSAFIDEAALPPLDADDPAAPDADAAGSDDPAATGDPTGARPPRNAADRAAAARPAATSPGPSIPWARDRWRIAAGHGADVPCWLVAVAAARVIAAGPTVLVAADDTRAPTDVGPDIDAVALAANDDALFAVTRRGALFASADAGVSWTAFGAPWPARDGALSIAATPGRLWIREGDALWSARWSTSAASAAAAASSASAAPTAVRREGVRAITSAGSALIVLADRGPELHIERLRADDEPAPSEPLPAATRAALADHTPLLAATAAGRVIGLHVAGVLHISRDAGRTFRAFDTGPALALTFAGSGIDARVLLLVAGADRAREPQLHLLEGQPDGRPARVADLRAVAPAGRAALAWDAARELAWVACPAGLLAFERSTQH